MGGYMKEKRDELQKKVGNRPKISLDKFVNWGETQKRDEVLTCYPTSLEEIQAVIKGCRALGIRVRATGASHSWSPLFSDEGNMVMFTKDIKRHDGPQIELIQNADDPNEKHVTVMTNVTTGDLMDFEVSHGVCLPANVVLQVVTYGGVVSPACHGVGRDCKTVSDYVTAMRIVDSDGVLRNYSIQEDGMEVMLAIQGNMGLFGIIYDITFKMQNQVIVQTDTIFVKAEKVFYDKAYIKELFEKNWSVEILWFPFNGMSLQEITESVFEHEVDCGEWDPKQDDVWIRLVNKPEKVGEVKSRKSYRLEGVRSWLEHTAGSVIDGAVVLTPGLTPSFLQMQLKIIKRQFEGSSEVQHLPHAIHFRDNIEEMPAYDMEWAMDCDDKYENFCKSTQYVIDQLKKLAAEGKFPVTLGMEMRLMEHSDIYMAPALAGNPKCGGSGHTLYIEVLSLLNTKGWEEFSDDVSQFWRKMPGARPHWCKEWGKLSGIDEHIKKMYKEQFPKFLAQLEKSKADPDGIFFNDRLEKLLFPKGHDGWKKLQQKQGGDSQQNKGGNQKNGQAKNKESSGMCALI